MDSISVQFNHNPSTQTSLPQQSTLESGIMSANAAELTAALSLLRPPITAAFSQIPTFSFSDPSALLLLTQQLQNTRSFSALPVSNVTSTSSTHNNNQLTKKSINEIQPPASPQSSSCSSVISSSPQPSPQRKHAAPVPLEKKDEAYYERRRKNNDAAKRSRDARRQKEEIIAAKAAFLEQENIRLRSQIEILKNEIATLRIMLISSHTTSFEKTQNKVEP